MSVQLALSRQELDVVVNHLAVGRYIDVANIMNKISQQVQEQMPKSLAQPDQVAPASPPVPLERGKGKPPSEAA